MPYSMRRSSGQIFEILDFVRIKEKSTIPTDKLFELQDGKKGLNAVNVKQA